MTANAEKLRRWREANPEKYAEQRRRYRQRHREELAAKQRARYQADPENARAIVARYRDANRVAINDRRRADSGRQRERERAWRERNIEKKRATYRRYYRRNREKEIARVRFRQGAAFSSDATAFLPVLRKDPCAYCGGGGGHIDHIRPLAGGGDSELSNLTSACRSCNSAKRDRSLLIFLLGRTA